MRRWLTVLLSVAMLALSACAENGSSNSSSSGNSSNNGSSNNGGSSNGSSNKNKDGSSNNGGSSNGSSNNGGSSNGGSSDHRPGGTGGDGTTVPGGATGTVPSEAPPPPPTGFTLPEPDSNGNVKVPDEPPKEVRNQTPRKRLSELPPIPTSCLDSDLTLLDVFAPFVSVPLRFTYCLLYIGTVARLPSEINVTVNTPSANGGTVPVGLLPPNQSQRPVATLALVILLVVIAIGVGYVMGRRRREANP